MGKLGAFELNYSSDIDLIVLFDPDRLRYRGRESPMAFAVRLTRTLVHVLEHRTREGYVFRTDLRLRPHPPGHPLALSVDDAEQYYERHGQNWERAALIKARVIAGDRAAGDGFLRALEPFLWRRHLDYAAIRDIHSIKRQINAYRGHGQIRIAGHDLKVGRGGIREIEFFVQTQQLILGGRLPELRVPGTCAALRALVEARWLEAATADELIEAYRFLRRAEHRLQMVGDKQTHALPARAGATRAVRRIHGLCRTRMRWRRRSGPASSGSKRTMPHCSRPASIWAAAAPWCSPAPTTTRTRWSPSPRWASPSRKRSRRGCAPGTTAIFGRPAMHARASC